MSHNLPQVPPSPSNQQFFDHTIDQLHHLFSNLLHLPRANASAPCIVPTELMQTALNLINSLRGRRTDSSSADSMLSTLLTMRSEIDSILMPLGLEGYNPTSTARRSVESPTAHRLETRTQLDPRILTSQDEHVGYALIDIDAPASVSQIATTNTATNPASSMRRASKRKLTASGDDDEGPATISGSSRAGKKPKSQATVAKGTATKPRAKKR